MKKLSFLAAAMMVSLAAYAQTPQEVAEKYNEAVAKINAKDYAGSIPLLEEAIKMGESAGEEAESTLEMAREALPKMYFSTGGTLVQGQKFAEAVPYLEKAAEMGHPRAKSVLGQVYNAQGAAAWNKQDYKTSAELFAKAHEATPDNKKITAQLAESYGKLKEYDKSYEVFRELTATGDEAAKERLAFYMLLNANEIRTSNPVRAVEILSEAVELDNNPQAWMLLLQTAQPAKIAEIGERAAEAQTDAVQKSNAYSLLGSALEKTGNPAKAIEAYRKVVSGPNAAAAKAQAAALSAQ